MDPHIPTPDAFAWLVNYWPLLTGVVATTVLAALTLNDVRTIKRWVLNHRHDPETGAVYMPADALGDGSRRSGAA